MNHGPEPVRVEEVFVPAGFPLHTYVDRDNGKYEVALSDCLKSPGLIASISGPSKTGKTMLTEKVAGKGLVTVSGARIESTRDLWDRVLEELRAPRDVKAESERSAGTGISGKLGGGLFGGAKGEVSLSRDSKRSQRITTTSGRDGLSSVLELMVPAGRVLLVDDFHFISREAQSAIAREFKEAAQKGMRICVAVVPHRADDVVRSLPELRARVRSIDLAEWSVDDLVRIAELGFEKLRVSGSILMPHEFAKEAGGSPALMQNICLEACRDLCIHAVLSRTRTVDLSDQDYKRILHKASATANMKSQVQAMMAGPKLRGKRRQSFRLKDGTEGDVYYCVLRAICADPARRSFPYNELVPRVSALIAGAAKPAGSAISGACHQMAQIAAERFEGERIIDWDEKVEVLDIVDPYFWFYLRWSGLIDPALAKDSARGQPAAARTTPPHPARADSDRGS